MRFPKNLLNLYCNINIANFLGIKNVYKFVFSNFKMNVIKKIYLNDFDDEVHSHFIKFSRGKFDNKYLIEAKKQKSGFVIKTSAEFANFFVKLGLARANEKVNIKGAIISTLKIEKDITFPIENVKQFMGIKQIIVNTSVSKNQILDLMEKYPRVFFALSFSLPDYELKIKAKAPKSAKPSTSGDKEVKADFCSLKTNFHGVIEDLLFDVKEFASVKIKHTIQINDIILPTEEKDPVRIRELSKRKGTLIRNINVDDKATQSEHPFEA